MSCVFVRFCMNFAMIEDLIVSMRSYYDERAPEHDEYMGFTTLEAMERLLKPIIDRIDPLVRNKRVLEIACGTGNWTQVLAKRAKEVVAIDSSPQCLEIAAKKLQARSNVTLLQADAYDMRPVSGTFQMAFMADWWSHIPHQRVHRFLSELHRHLKRDASVIILDMTWRTDFAKQESEYDDEGNRVFKRALSNGLTFQVIKNFPTRSELEAALEGWVVKFHYFSFEELERWLITYRVKEMM